MPRNVLTASEAEAIINGANINDPIGIRDRAILETLYSTGMRRMELIKLSIYDVYREAGTVMIRQGKGRKDRVVPIGERALGWIDKYLQEVRPALMTGHDEGTLFLTIDSDGFTGDHLSGLVTRYIERANIGKKGSCHLFRHTMATLMLEAGADIRFIQQMLGHASLETTQIYTRVSIRQLKEIHSATHPARIQRSEVRGQRSEVEAQNPQSAIANPQSELGNPHTEELLSSLAAEAAAVGPFEQSKSDGEPSAEQLLSSLAAEAAEEEDQLAMKP